MKFYVAFFLISLSFSGFSQQEESAAEKKTANRYVGIQANQLLRQLLNFGGSSSSINNPYLLTFAVNSKKYGVGLNTGLGYTYNKFQNGDSFTPRETTIHDFFFRIGLEDKVFFGKRWFASYGVDLVFDNSKNKTVSSFDQGQGFPVNKITTETLVKSSGFGPRVTLNFAISDKIIVGTEANYYYRASTSTIKATGQTDITSKPKSFALNVPAVLYLILKF